MISKKLVRFGCLILSLGQILPLCGTSITGGGETIATAPSPTPTPAAAESTPPPGEPEGPTETRPPSAPKPLATGEYARLLKEARNHFREKDFAAALEKVLLAESLKPEISETTNFHGAICGELGRYEEAIQLYQKSLSQNPKSFWPAYNLGEVEFMQSKYPEARAKFEKMTEGFPDHELVRFKIVLTYLLEGNDAAAQAEIDKFKFPSDSAAREFSMAAWEFSHQRPAEATEWMNSGVRIFGLARTDFLYQSLAALKWVPADRETNSAIVLKENGVPSASGAP